MTAYIFSDTAKDFSALEGSRIVEAITAADNGNLTLLKDMYANPCGFGVDSLVRGFYKLAGWQFDISEFCSTYLVKDKWGTAYHKYLAPTKECLRHALRGSIGEIVLYEKKPHRCAVH